MTANWSWWRAVLLALGMTWLPFLCGPFTLYYADLTGDTLPQPELTAVVVVVVVGSAFFFDLAPRAFVSGLVEAFRTSDPAEALRWRRMPTYLVLSHWEVGGELPTNHGFVASHLYKILPRFTSGGQLGRALSRLKNSADTLRVIRTIEILALIGTDDARRLLCTLASGAEEAPVTQVAKAALQRLDGRNADSRD